MTEATLNTPTLTRTHAPCVACNAAYRREALALFERLVQAAPDRVVIDDEIRTIMANTLASYPTGVVQMDCLLNWTPALRREVVADINNDPEPFQYVGWFRTILKQYGDEASDIPAAQHCSDCEALSCDIW